MKQVINTIRQPVEKITLRETNPKNVYICRGRGDKDLKIT